MIQLNQIIKQHDKVPVNNKKPDSDNSSMFDEAIKMVYMKPWNRLPNFHKKVKLTEYVNELYAEHKDHKKILNLLVNALEDNNLGTIKHVVYDNKNSKIINIPVLCEINGKFQLKIKK